MTTGPETPNTTPPDPSRADLLVSWKDIAAHFKCTVRTVQRWEGHEGLPVYRHRHAKGHTIYAYKEELEAWRDTRKPRSDEPEPEPECEPDVMADRPEPREVPGTMGQWVVPAVALLAFLVLVSAVWKAARLPAADRAAASLGRLLANATREGAPLLTIPVGKEPGDVAISQDGLAVYVLNHGSGSISVVDPLARSTTRTINVGKSPTSMVLSADGNWLYAGHYGGSISIVNTHSGAIRSEATAGPVTDLVLTPDGRTLYFAQRFRGLWAIHFPDSKMVQISAETIPAHLALNPDGSRLYVNYQGLGPGGSPGHDAISVLDATTFRPIANPAGFPNVGGPLAISPDGKQVWANGLDACSAPSYDHAGCPTMPGAIFNVIRVADNQKIRSLGFPDGSRVSFFPDSSRAVITGSTVQVVDTSNFSVLESLGLNGAGNVVFSADGKRAYYPMEAQDALAVFDLASNPCTPPPVGMTAWWPGDGNASDVRGLNNGAIQGRTKFVPGRVGQAFFLEDFDSSVNFGSLANLDSRSEFTVSLWIKLSGYDPTGSEIPILDRGPRSGSSPHWRVVKSGGALEFRAEPCSPQCLARLTSLEGLRQESFQHVAVSVTPSRVALFLNGELQQASALTKKIPAGGDLRLHSGPDRKSFMRLYADEIQWFNRALSDAEVGSIYSAGSAGICYAGPPAQPR